MMKISSVSVAPLRQNFKLPGRNISFGEDDRKKEFVRALEDFTDAHNILYIDAKNDDGDYLLLKRASDDDDDD